MHQQSPVIAIQSLKNQQLIADKCYVADRFFSRLIGLIGRRHIARGEGMYFPRCNDIHMWFMSVAIDVVFIRAEKGADGKVTRTVTSTREELKPWRVLPAIDPRATDTLELPAGAVRLYGIARGDELCIS